MDTETVQSESVEASEATDTTEPLAPLQPQKKPRSIAQLKSLEAARAKALQVRKENAQLRDKERAVAQAQKATRKAAVEEAYSKLPTSTQEPDWDTPIEEWPEDPPMPVAPAPQKPKRRKPARRVIVTEVSSESEEEDVEVVLPKYKPPPAPSREELHMQRAMEKMFNYGI